MGRRRGSVVSKEPKRKAVKVRLAPREHAGQVTEPYRIMEAIIESDRQDLKDVRIGIAWHTGWRPDADGVRTHGKCIKRTDLDRSLDTYDVMIVLNEQSWKGFDDAGKQRLIFHELEHAQVARDKNGEPLIDDKNRIVIRMKRHNVADFADVIERFGLPPCLQDVDIADGDRPLLKFAEQKAKSAAERMYTVNEDGFVDNPIEFPIPTPVDFQVDVKLLFARIDDRWYSGFEIKGRGERTRRINTIRDLFFAELRDCLSQLRSDIGDALFENRSRLAEFLQFKIDAAIQAIEDREADLAEAMAEPVRWPMVFLTGAKEESATESTEATEVNEVNKVNKVPSSGVSEPEILTFKAKGIKQANVTITLQRRDDDWWRAGFVWQLGNATDGERCEASDWYQGKQFCRQNLLSSVAISLAAMQISGTADARRSMESRRNTLREQFEDWLEEKIDAEEAAKPADVPVEEDQPRNQ